MPASALEPPLPSTASAPPPTKEPEKPNFGLSGALAKDMKTGNVYNGIQLKWSEPQDAKQPTRHWRLYVFKGAYDSMRIHIV
jgi:smad nuclear-interacting protein 1